jgi:hypothetical protein
MPDDESDSSPFSNIKGFFRRPWVGWVLGPAILAIVEALRRWFHETQ